MSVNFCFVGAQYLSKTTKELRAYFHSQFEGTVHHGGEIMAAGVGGSWSHGICTQEAQAVNAGAQLPFFLGSSLGSLTKTAAVAPGYTLS